MAYSIAERDRLVLGELRFRGGWVPQARLADSLPFSLYIARQSLERLLIRDHVEFRVYEYVHTHPTSAEHLRVGRHEYRARI